jgi:hypothetical protein
MKALLIDPFTQTTLDVDCDGSLQSMYKLIGCDTVEPVAFDDLHSIWLDENALAANCSVGSQFHWNFRQS